MAGLSIDPGNQCFGVLIRIRLTKVKQIRIRNTALNVIMLQASALTFVEESWIQGYILYISIIPTPTHLQHNIFYP